MRDRVLLAVLAAAMAAALVLFFVKPRTRAAAADIATFQEVVSDALDSNAESRVERWHAAHEQIARLDPNRPTAAAPFVRSGLFHWYELSEADRRSVLLAIEPLLHDEKFFGRMAQPLFQLTGDFRLLRRANPGTDAAIADLASMAVKNGRFADYRLFREQLRSRRYNAFAMSGRTATPAQLVALVPVVATKADEALLAGILTRLHSRPIDNDQVDPRRAGVLTEYALDHDLQPLDGLEVLVRFPTVLDDPVRARLALRLGQFDRAAGIEETSRIASRDAWHRYYVERALAEMRRHESLQALEYLQKAEDGTSVDVIAATEEMQRLAGNAELAASAHRTLVARSNKIDRWQGNCGNEVCEHSSGTLWSEGAPYTLKLATVQSDDVPPYAEIYTDDAMTAEGAVSPALLARAELSGGLHRVDVRLANPMTRNAIRRRVRIE